MNVVSLIAIACHLSQATQTIDPVKNIEERLIGKVYTASFSTEYGGAIEESTLRDRNETFPYSTVLLAKYLRESERLKTGFSLGGLRMIVDLSDGRTALVTQEGGFMLRGKNGKVLGYYMIDRVDYMKLAVAVELFLSRIGRS